MFICRRRINSNTRFSSRIRSCNQASLPSNGYYFRDVPGLVLLLSVGDYGLKVEFLAESLSAVTKFLES